MSIVTIDYRISFQEVIEIWNTHQPILTEGFFIHIIQRMLNYISDDFVLSPAKLEQLTEWLGVLSEPKRLRIFNLLMAGVQCNCELGDNLQMAPNLISHHLNKLRAAGLVQAARDPADARWIYYSVNRAALDELNAALGAFLNPARIQQRRPACGPHKSATLSGVSDNEEATNDR